MSTPADRTPVNKQATIFMGRRPRLETIQQALDKFAAQICSPEVALNVREMITGDGKGKALKIEVTIEPDGVHEGKFRAKMKTHLSRQLGCEVFSELS